MTNVGPRASKRYSAGLRCCWLYSGNRARTDFVAFSWSGKRHFPAASSLPLMACGFWTGPKPTKTKDATRCLRSAFAAIRFGAHLAGKPSWPMARGLKAIRILGPRGPPPGGGQDEARLQTTFRLGSLKTRRYPPRPSPAQCRFTTI